MLVTGFTHGCLLFLGLEVILDVLEVDLLILHVILHSHVFHVLSAQEAQILQRLRHIHDGLSNLAETERNL